jgi:cytochrome subunit of sulfide dehydrogenase
MNRKFLRMKGLPLPGALIALLLTGAAFADDATVNRLLAAQCAQCHGTNGYALGDMDELAGESAKDLYEDLTDMKGEDRPEDIMDHQALGYTDDQIRRIASYYAGLPEDEPGSAGAGSSEGGTGFSDSEEDEEDEEDREEEHD